jgi:hypothetical protein
LSCVLAAIIKVGYYLFIYSSHLEIQFALMHMYWKRFVWIQIDFGNRLLKKIRLKRKIHSRIGHRESKHPRKQRDTTNGLFLWFWQRAEKDIILTFIHRCFVFLNTRAEVMKPAVDEMFPEGAGPYVDLDEVGVYTWFSVRDSVKDVYL